MNALALEFLQLDRARVLEALERCLAQPEIADLRAEVQGLLALADAAAAPADDAALTVRRDVFRGDLEQILEAHTLQRAHYYVERLRKSLTAVRTSEFNDINLNRWKEYDDLITDSLWIMERRDQSGGHRAWYWGNFIPQIPHQMLRRYTRPGEWVLDTFAGSGTTLIECRRLGRNGLGVELNPEVAARAREIVAAEPNPHAIATEIVEGDSAAVDYNALLAAHQIPNVQLLLMHPPYYDIIRFSEDARDLSNAASVQAFVAQFAAIVARATPVLAARRFLAVVIGDKYVQGEWIPLGFYVMQAVLEQGYTLKSIIVKNFDETRAKRSQKELWRYRALAGGFYVFKHEYIFLFQKRP